MRLGGKVGVSNPNVSDTQNETIGGMVMAMNKEENQASDQGQDDRNPDWLEGNAKASVSRSIESKKRGNQKIMSHMY